MIENVFLINKHSQIKELGSDLKFRILNELILNPATCQQLADILGVSKQKAHYNLKGLLAEDLIVIEDNTTNNKEVYYRARAKNYILDFSLGKNTANGAMKSREILDSILQDNYGINLDYIAVKMLNDCLRLKSRERLLITTGKNNMPLVERLLVEAGRRQIDTTLLYQHMDYIRAKNNEFSLSALIRDYERFNSLLQTHDVFLNLNGEARYVPMADKERLAIRQRSYLKSQEIITKNHVRVAIMPGLMKETLEEGDIVTEINFWKALDIDYRKLYEATDAVGRNLKAHRRIVISDLDATLELDVDNVICEYGSFGDDPSVKPHINLPGGRVLVIPGSDTLNGTIVAKQGWAFGERINNPRITFRNNRIVDYTADNPEIIKQAIEEGGEDGGKVAFVYFNTNYNLGLGAIDTSFQQRMAGFLSVYWGDNVPFGGKVRGNVEWSIRLEAPEVILK